MSYQIKNRFTLEVIYTAADATTQRDAVLAAAKEKASLSRANLCGVDLSGADLSEVDLSGADLSGADLCRTSLSRANLCGVDLSGADLSEVDLSRVDLSGAYLHPIKEDFFAVLSAAPEEVPALRCALQEGRVEGTAYVGDCCCLIGTIANARQCDYREIPGLPPNYSRPAERWFLAIREGDVPAESEIMRITVEWIDEWTKARSLQPA